MDLEALRRAISQVVIDFPSMRTHESMSKEFAELGLPDPGEKGSKRQRAERCVEQLEDSKLPEIAERILAGGDVAPMTRNDIQEALWLNDLGLPEIPKKVRHQISRALQVETLFLNWDGFIGLLQKLWVIDDEPYASIDLMFGSTGNGNSLRARIERHVGRNPGDWTTEELFDQLGAIEASDRRFALFLEGLSSCAILPDEGAQRAFVDLVNQQLSAIGAKLEEFGEDGGYPAFRLSSTSRLGNRLPKNLIFASSVKPDIRFRSALDNDIEIVTNADRVLVY